MFPMEDYNNNQDKYFSYENLHNKPRLHLFYDSSSQEIKKSKKLIPPKKITKSYWKAQENRRYLHFLEQNQELMMMPLKQRTDMKVNKKMSEHVKSRSATQCRSHHQKMVEKHSSISQIIATLRRELSGSLLEDRSMAKIPNIKIIVQPQDYQYSNQNEEMPDQYYEMVLTSILL